MLCSIALGAVVPYIIIIIVDFWSFALSDLPGPAIPLVLEGVEVHTSDAPLSVLKPKTGNGNGNHIKDLRPRVRMVIMLSENGYRNIDIARALGYTQSRVSTLVNSRNPRIEAFKRNFALSISERLEDVPAKLQAASPPAVDALIMVMKSDDLGQKRQAARDILDRAGYSPVKKQLIVNAPMPTELMHKLVETIEDSNRASALSDDFSFKVTEEIIPEETNLAKESYQEEHA